jgi:hypothetical protein
MGNLFAFQHRGYCTKLHAWGTKNRNNVVYVCILEHSTSGDFCERNTDCHKLGIDTRTAPGMRKYSGFLWIPKKLKLIAHRGLLWGTPRTELHPLLRRSLMVRTHEPACLVHWAEQRMDTAEIRNRGCYIVQGHPRRTTNPWKKLRAWARPVVQSGYGALTRPPDMHISMSLTASPKCVRPAECSTPF